MFTAAHGKISAVINNKFTFPQKLGGNSFIKKFFPFFRD